MIKMLSEDIKFEVDVIQDIYEKRNEMENKLNLKGKKKIDWLEIGQVFNKNLKENDVIRFIKYVEKTMFDTFAEKEYLKIFNKIENINFGKFWAYDVNYVFGIADILYGKRITNHELNNVIDNIKKIHNDKPSLDIDEVFIKIMKEGM